MPEGLLVDCYDVSKSTGAPPTSRGHPHAIINLLHVYKRGGCTDFMSFCLQNFVVGVWSSNHAFESKSQCTGTDPLHTVEESEKKSRARKDLCNLWDGDKGLPWRKGAFGPSNTILLDDDPYTNLGNPPHTTIPLKISVTAPRAEYLGKLQKYLKLLAYAKDVRELMKQTPFDKFEERQNVEVKSVGLDAFNLDGSIPLDLLINRALAFNIDEPTTHKEINVQKYTSISIASSPSEREISVKNKKQRTGRKNYSIQIQNTVQISLTEAKDNRPKVGTSTSNTLPKGKAKSEDKKATSTSNTGTLPKLKAAVGSTGNQSTASTCGTSGRPPKPKAASKGNVTPVSISKSILGKPPKAKAAAGGTGNRSAAATCSTSGRPPKPNASSNGKLTPVTVSKRKGSKPTEAKAPAKGTGGQGVSASDVSKDKLLKAKEAGGKGSWVKKVTSTTNHGNVPKLKAVAVAEVTGGQVAVPTSTASCNPPKAKVQVAKKSKQQWQATKSQRCG
ncbi:hypothetical protein R1flu_003544 [Riccia fluitans]|uniref:Mitochondrial import inner membrane translocase subunit TIM50 n=1 Tax=Riccia fluitans TaxID=41844 RepID=A0ABD1Y9B0_9MARC